MVDVDAAVELHDVLLTAADVFASQARVHWPTPQVERAVDAADVAIGKLLRALDAEYHLTELEQEAEEEYY